MLRLRHHILGGVSSLVIALPVVTSSLSLPVPALAAATEPALLSMKTDAKSGKIFVTLPSPDENGVYGRYLYASALRTGVGSARIRLDHGMLGPTRVLAFRKIGNKVAVIFENPKFTSRGDKDIREGVERSFPFSVICMLDMISTGPGGTVTADLTPFFLHDTMDIATSLNGGGLKLPDVLDSGAKGFHQLPSLGGVDLSSLKSFPENIEVEAVQTFASETPGPEMSLLSPDPGQVSFTVHHSLVKLPDAGFVPRKFDIRSGSHASPVYDFGAPLGEDVLLQYANRFRLVKIDPTAAKSRVVKPIVFYIDNAAPEPVRSALAEGVSWWNQAFEAAGFIDAFQVRILPPGVDPQDIRYNIVNWNERQTRSYSYGMGVIDPRTGEIIRGNVVLEGLRLRQDLMIFEALAGTAAENSGGANDAVRVSLARIRQLGVHEVGHAIGLIHNFMGSTQDRTSVMDYPGPRIGIKDGKIDLSDAYATGVGAWDKYMIDWLYGDPAPGKDPDVAAAQKADAIEKAGFRFGTDIDGRDPDTGLPGNSMWTDGADKPADLKHMLDVRQIALSNFGPGTLRKGEALSDLRRKFVPLWLLHRYNIEATAKIIGGVDFRYAVVGGVSAKPVPADAGLQKAAIDALLDALSPKVLAVSPALALELSFGVNGNEDPQYNTEIFRTAGSAVFDPLNATDVAAQITLNALLGPNRLERVHLQHGHDPAQPGLDYLLDRIASQIIARHSTEVEQRIAYRTLVTMASVRDNPKVTPDVALALSGALKTAADQLGTVHDTDADASWSHRMSALLKDQPRLAREAAKATRPAPTIPPGTPIGGGEDDWLTEEQPF
ncbi:DUF5117 domain-containing protein [Gluconacetobacter sp. 1b LMG 1731]|uniref:DUF5117 domain-containing protein n=1 Tax=Gluconacetobacter dulcium TaxID=2729096 RepID=A0A7W4IMA9_9PROT|nr:zinc-dependent metalloprotease [Gluconacetobacter dulcium]MBB2165520.1 DUF5117 domain-containing protein [Gluconacetobacter dulcium]MBB2194656.1 DUF5117 domain-containing protein [Gluconacetobacter dulcium]